MGASFRSTEQIKALAGCDRLTIAPKFLKELAASHTTLERALETGGSAADHTTTTEVEFRWGINENPMATEKLAEGIRSFDADHRKLLDLLSTKL